MNIFGTILTICLINTVTTVRADEPSSVWDAMLSDPNMIRVDQCGAVGDGRTDDTVAFRSAIERLRSTKPARPTTILMPAGTYVISGELKIPAGCRMQGAGPEKSILQFSDAGHPNPTSADNAMAVIRVARLPTMNATPTFSQTTTIAGITIDTGQNDRVHGLTCEGGSRVCVRDVVIRTAKNGESDGIRTEPCDESRSTILYLSDVEVHGFRYCVVLSGGQTSHAMLRRVKLVDPMLGGIFNRSRATIRRLHSRSETPAILTNASGASLCITDSLLTGGDHDQPAIHFRDQLFARNVTSFSFESALRQNGQKISHDFVDESSFPEIVTTKNASGRSLYLQRRSQVANAIDKPCSIAKVPSYRNADDQQGDWSRAIQAAIDSGAAAIYFPAGDYPTATSIVLNETVQQFVGVDARIVAASKSNGDTPPRVIIERATNQQGPIRTVPTLHVEGLSLPAIEHRSGRAVCLQDCAVGSYVAIEDVGSIAIDNVIGADWAVRAAATRASDALGRAACSGARWSVVGRWLAGEL